jgi:hypothetical protein
MTRHTATEKRGRALLRLVVTTERDEASGYRHQWTTTVRLGLLSGSGPNLKAALAGLEADLLALASSEAATSALAAERVRPADPQAAKPSPIAKYSPGATVEALISVRDSDEAWCEVEYLNERHGGQLHAVWSERYGTLVLPDDRVRDANRPPLADVG